METLAVEAEPQAAEPASIPQVQPQSPPSARTDASPELPAWWLAAGAGVLLLGWMGWRRARRREPIAEAAADGFEAELDSARIQALADPRVTADVIKLWMRA